MSAAHSIEWGCHSPYDDISENGTPYTGTDPARRAIYGILNDLGGRGGIKRELGGIEDNNVRREIVETLTAIVRESYAYQDHAAEPESLTDIIGKFTARAVAAAEQAPVAWRITLDDGSASYVESEADACALGQHYGACVDPLYAEAIPSSPSAPAGAGTTVEAMAEALFFAAAWTDHSCVWAELIRDRTTATQGIVRHFRETARRVLARLADPRPGAAADLPPRAVELPREAVATLHGYLGRLLGIDASRSDAPGAAADPWAPGGDWTPNAVTIAAMEDAEAGRTVAVTLDEMRAEILEDDGAPTFSPALEAAIKEHADRHFAAGEPSSDEEGAPTILRRCLDADEASRALRRAIRAELDASRSDAPGAGRALRQLGVDEGGGDDA